jgi:hypothetical protein
MTIEELLDAAMLPPHLPPPPRVTVVRRQPFHVIVRYASPLCFLSMSIGAVMFVSGSLAWSSQHAVFFSLWFVLIGLAFIVQGVVLISFTEEVILSDQSIVHRRSCFGWRREQRIDRIHVDAVLIRRRGSQRHGHYQLVVHGCGRAITIRSTARKPLAYMQAAITRQLYRLPPPFPHP